MEYSPIHKTDMTEMMDKADKNLVPEGKFQAIVIITTFYIFLLSILVPPFDKSLAYFCFLLVYLICSIYRLFQPKSKFSGRTFDLIDLNLLVLLVYEIVNFFLSSYSPNTFLYLEKAFGLTVLYFLLKFYVVQENRINRLIFLLTLFAFAV